MVKKRLLHSRSERDAPEVDGEVMIDANSHQLMMGQFYSVEIYDCNEYDLFANFCRA
jgi:ribosomal protein S12 methylthiotransferase